MQGIFIGYRRLDSQSVANRRRLDVPNDYTRLKIGTALQRNHVRVNRRFRCCRKLPGCPDARMPGKDDLPDDLMPLARPTPSSCPTNAGSTTSRNGWTRSARHCLPPSS